MLPRATLTSSINFAPWLLSVCAEMQSGNGSASSSAQKISRDRLSGQWIGQRLSGRVLRLYVGQPQQRSGAPDWHPPAGRCCGPITSSKIKTSPALRLAERTEQGRVGRALRQTTALIAPGVKIDFVVRFEQRDRFHRLENFVRLGAHFRIIGQRRRLVRECA